MDVTFYGRLADHAGRRLTVAAPASGCRVGELRALIGIVNPALGAALSASGISAFVRDEMVGDDHHLDPADAIEFWPPVSGG